MVILLVDAELERGKGKETGYFWQKKTLLKSYERWKSFAKKSLLEAQKSYRIGRINFLQLSQVQQSLDNAESSYWDTWYDFHSKRLKMLNLQGQVL